MAKLLRQIIADILGIGISVYLLSEVTFDGKITTILLVGATLGFLNFFIKPIIKKITLPLRIITLNLFSLVIVIGLVWGIDSMVPRSMFEISGIEALFWTSLIVLGVEIIFSLFSPKK